MQRSYRTRLRVLLGAIAAGGLMATLAPGAPAAGSPPAAAPDDNAIMCQGNSFIVPTNSTVESTSQCSGPTNTTIRYVWHVVSPGASACLDAWSRSGWIDVGCHSPGDQDYRDVRAPSGSFWYPKMEGTNYSPTNAANIGWEWGT